MQQAPTSGADGTAAGDIQANATSFARHLRAANKSTERAIASHRKLSPGDRL